VTDYRVLVTGSRTWDDRAAVNGALDALLAEHGTLIVVHGACREGADKMAHDWALEKHYATSYGAVTIEPHPADWRPDGVFDRAAGPKRNAEMVSLGADLCLAFVMPCADQRCRIAVEHGSHGASHCVTLAEKAGIEVRLFRP
jgi:hypothetical protein